VRESVDPDPLERVVLVAKMFKQAQTFTARAGTQRRFRRPFGEETDYRSIIQIFAVRSLSGKTNLSVDTPNSWNITRTFPSERRAL